jgi:hypothetical protein
VKLVTVNPICKTSDSITKIIEKRIYFWGWKRI